MDIKTRAFIYGIFAIIIILLINIVVLAILKFPGMAIFQIKKYIWLLIPLVLGFGFQVALYTYLKHMNLVCGITTAASGGISSTSMILCCSHYLVNILPFISISTASFLTKYTFQILLIGLASNVIGILIMLNKILKFKKKVNKNNENGI